MTLVTLRKPKPAITASTEVAVRDALHECGIDLAVCVPCKYLARLIADIEDDERFSLIYPSREEEGVGIAAGAYLAGRKSVMLIQNSGLGNMVNAYCSLNLYYEIPLCLIVSQRGDELEKVRAQVPMGSRTEALLAMLNIEVVKLGAPDDMPKFTAGLARHTSTPKSVAFVTKKTFWNA